MEQPSYTKQLLMQLNQQRSAGHLCDVVIVVENALFRAHKNVLAACSSYFKCLVLQDNLIALNNEMVKPSVFKQVLDFIYTGQLHHAGDHGVLDLLRAASYLQLSDLAALCRSKLKQCRSRDWSPSTASSLTANSHLPVGYNYHSESMEVRRTRNGLQREDLSEEELFTAVSSYSGVDINKSVETGLGLRLKLTRKSPKSLQQSSLNTNSSTDLPFNPIPAFINPRLEHIEQQHPTTNSQQTAAHKRPRSGWEGCLEGSVRTKRQEVESGQPVQAEWRVSSELEGRAEVKEEDLDLKNELQNSEKEMLNGNGYVHHEPQPGFQPALHNKLYVCVPCGKGFQSSEQLIAHVHSHTAEELRIKAEDAAERSLIKTEDRDSQPTTEEPKPDATPPRHVCLVCGKSFVDVVLLRQHERSHWLNRPFTCDVCGKPFTQRGTMTRHMRSHLGLKPFECEECGMRFTRQYRKMEHMRIHSRERTCQLCGEKFAHQRSLYNHLKMHTTVA